VVCVAAVFICIHVFQSGDMHYYFGGWLPPAGIEFKITKFNSVITCLISVISTATFLHGKNVMFDEIDISKINSFCGVFLICLAGFIGVLLTNDFFNLYVFIEISSLASYSLISISKDKSSIKAAFCYLIIGSIAATFILIGIAYIYSASGTLNIDDFISKLPNIQESNSVRIGYCLILVGILIKSGLFPLHTWLVDSYKSTNSFIVPFLNGTSSKIYIFLAINLTYLIFGIHYSFHHLNISFIFGAMGAMAIIMCSLAALYQSNLRNMLIFSTVSQIGYTFVALGLGSKASAVAAIMFLFGNILAKSSLFMLASNIYLNRRSYDMSKLHNLKSHMPIVVVLFAINGASIAGVPLTIGFSAKISLIIELIKKDMWVMLAIVLCSSLVAILYIWKFMETFLYSKAGSINDSKRKDGFGVYSERELYFPLSIIAFLTGANLICGVFFNRFAEFLNNLIL
jgi:multicomponent Na+:H+ antiporter subunit D